MVTYSGRTLDAQAERTHEGFFLRCGSAEPLHQGAIVEIDGKPHRVKWLLRFPAGEPTLWAIAEQLVPQTSGTEPQNPF